MGGEYELTRCSSECDEKFQADFFHKAILNGEGGGVGVGLAPDSGFLAEPNLIGGHWAFHTLGETLIDLSHLGVEQTQMMGGTSQDTNYWM